MKTAKLVLGVFSILFFLVVVLQSCTMGVVNIVESIENGRIESISGTGGILTAFLMLAGGITSISARKYRGGAVACLIIYSLGAFVSALCGDKIYIGAAFKYSRLWLYFWSLYCFAHAVFFVFAVFVEKYPEKLNDTNQE